MTPTIKSIVIICQLSFGQEKPKKRDRRNCDYRKLTMLILWLVYGSHPHTGGHRQPGRLTVTRIGRIFNRKHSDVIHQIKQALNLIETDKQFKQKFELTAKILIG
jgi:hypothetical protein